jgi:hypothetical protein
MRQALLVIFVRHEAKEGLFRHGTEGWQLAAGLVVEPQHVRVRKTTIVASEVRFAA